jgi:hypothetical protein
VNGGYGYGPREATLLDAQAAHTALEAIAPNDPRWQAAWDEAFTTSRNYFRSVQRDREQRQAAAATALQADLFCSSDPTFSTEAGQ